MTLGFTPLLHHPFAVKICTVNPEFIIDARRDPQFATVLQRADLRVPDGIGVLWAARLLGQPLHQRVTGSDGIYRICGRRHGKRVARLPARRGPRRRGPCCDNFATTIPHPHRLRRRQRHPTDADWPAIEQRLATAQPDILFVAFGHPRQDFGSTSIAMHCPRNFAIGVGGAFDFVAGVTVRARVGCNG